MSIKNDHENLQFHEYEFDKRTEIEIQCLNFDLGHLNYAN